MTFFTASGRYTPLQSAHASLIPNDGKDDDEEHTVYLHEALNSSRRDSFSYSDLTPDPNDDFHRSAESGWEDTNEKVTFNDDGTGDDGKSESKQPICTSSMDRAEFESMTTSSGRSRFGGKTGSVNILLT